MRISQFLSRLSPRALAGVVFGVVFGGTSVVVGYFFFNAVAFRTNLMHHQISSMAADVADLVDIELHERLSSPEQLASEEYRRALAPLAHFHLRHQSLEYVFTVRWGQDGRDLIILDSTQDSAVAEKERQQGRQPKPSALLEEYHPLSDQTTARAALQEGRTYVFPIVYKDAFGSFIEARAPLRNASGRVLGYAAVDFPAGAFLHYVNEVRLTGLATLALALLLSSLLAQAAHGMRRKTRKFQAQIQASEAAEREQRDLAEKASMAKSELLAIASHDLKNPLSAIAGISGLLLEARKAQPENMTPEDLQALETIHSAARHMSEIVRGILTSEGIETGGLPFEPALVDLGQICRAVLKFNTIAATKKNVTLRLEMEEDLSGHFDAKLVREAVDNCVSNAIKYSPRDRATTVTLRAAAKGNVIEISVQDEGPGLTAEDLTQAFGKFKKLSARPTGGETSTGLGLSIVKTIAELHGGSVGCENNPGCGARFWMLLPLRSR